MSTEGNKAVLRRLIEAVNTGNPSTLEKVVGECYSADFVRHDGGPEGLHAGLEGAKQLLREIPGASPDQRVIIEDLFAEGDKVATRLTAHGTWASTGKPFGGWTLTIRRFVNGKIAEEWELGVFTEGGGAG